MYSMEVILSLSREPQCSSVWGVELFAGSCLSSCRGPQNGVKSGCWGPQNGVKFDCRGPRNEVKFGCRGPRNGVKFQS